MFFGRPMGIVEKAFYGTILVVGALALFIAILTGNFSWAAFLPGLPISVALIGSYFWIRLDVWRSGKTIKELSNENKTVKEDLISRRIDSRVAFTLLGVAAGAQICLLSSISEKLQCVILLCFSMFIFNCIARSIESLTLKNKVKRF